MANGTLLTWGAGDRGQLGDGSWTHRLSPGPIAVDQRFVSLHFGEASAALAPGGEVWRWGEDTAIPVRHPIYPEAEAIGPGADSAIMKDGLLYHGGEPSRGRTLF